MPYSGTTVDSIPGRDHAYRGHQEGREAPNPMLQKPSREGDTASQSLAKLLVDFPKEEATQRDQTQATNERRLIGEAKGHDPVNCRFFARDVAPDMLLPPSEGLGHFGYEEKNDDDPHPNNLRSGHALTQIFTGAPLPDQSNSLEREPANA